MKIAICPGHSESSPGVKKSGLVEYSECKSIANAVVSILNSKDIESECVEGNLLGKVEYINKNGFDLAIEIHLEDNDDKNIRGSSSYYMMRDAEARRLAEALSSSCALVLKSINNGPKVGWFNKVGPSSSNDSSRSKPKIDLFLAKITATSVIVCPFHISNVYEITKYKSLGVDVIANSIVLGLENYFRIKSYTDSLNIKGEDCD